MSDQMMANLAVANILPVTNASPAAAALALDAAGGSAAGLNGQGVFGELLGKQIAMLDPRLQEVSALIADAEAVDMSSQVVDPNSLIQQLAPLVSATQLTDTPLKKYIDDSDDDKSTVPSDASASVTPPDLSAVAIVVPAGNLPPTPAAITQDTGKELPPLAISVLPTSVDVKNNDQVLAANVQTETSTEFNAALAAKLAVEHSKSADPNQATQNQSQVQAQQNISTQAQTANATPVSAGIPQQVGTPHWDTGLGDKVVWMLGTNIKMAELHLNPPALGPLEVRISMSDGQANLSFMTQHNAVGEAIESAKARLREMMGDSGVNMGNVSVNVGSFAQQQQQQAQQQNSQTPSDSKSASDITWLPDGETVQSVTTTVQSLQDRGLVDLFA
ncbi:MAG: flagellar hook-length control protein FliK [Methylophilales bacterium]|nr:flagellar hook-length control protein FliK [Methylophilales bacterium]